MPSLNNQRGVILGRGASGNPPNRFDRFSFEPDLNVSDPDDLPAPSTQFFKDTSRTIIAYNDSPDVGFEASVNPYRGCEHGCSYCYARPTHEYLGFSAGLDFESKIMVKEDAPELLRRELSAPSWKPQPIAMSGVTDCYQPVERHLQLTRRCLEVLVAFRNPVAIITKNYLVTRDADLLSELARYRAAAVYISLTTLDARLTRLMEPRASSPKRRLAAIETLTRAGVPVGVMVAPIIPGLTDHEIPSVLAAAANAGARFAGYTIVRLPLAVAPLFEQWLEQHFPRRKQKVLNHLRSMKGGRLNDPRFGHRMRGEGPYADMIRNLFSAACRKAGIAGDSPELSVAAFRKPSDGQLALFE
ncbi:MAG: PA0069 family radical SAM protein [Acidobacteriota bacterium]|nr:PA0069 family radical SAM protein [Blastocatellia bacterium]MDW8240676.1 PA0069 family radical SAM protein [Acidobacteriota bacterium]